MTGLTSSALAKRRNNLLPEQFISHIIILGGIAAHTVWHKSAARLLRPTRAPAVDEGSLWADNAHVVCNGNFGPIRLRHLLEPLQDLPGL